MNRREHPPRDDRVENAEWCACDQPLREVDVRVPREGIVGFDELGNEPRRLGGEGAEDGSQGPADCVLELKERFWWKVGQSGRARSRQ